VPASALTANEAAVAAGVPLKQVHRIVDAGLLGEQVAVRHGNRMILGRDGLVGLRLAHLTAKVLTPAARRRVVAAVLRRAVVRMVHEQAVTIPVGPIRAEVRRGLGSLGKARAMVAVDPEVMGGAPCFRGTRIPVHDVADLLANGDDPAAIREAYPRLTAEQIALIPLYAAAYPRRGRPRRGRSVAVRPKVTRQLRITDLPPAA
jgi:uncharacterized protein (DUF433 family)